MTRTATSDFATEGSQMESGIREEVSVGHQRLAFLLCRKADQLGRVPVDHWWMKVTELYRQRAQRYRQKGNFEAVSEGFWVLCHAAGTHTETDVQESYLLSQLLPWARSQGSRRVFADAYVESRSMANRHRRRKATEELDGWLRQTRGRSLSLIDFHRQTADVLGPPAFSPEVAQAYDEFCSDFFDKARAALAADELRRSAGHARTLGPGHALHRSSRR